MAGARGWPAGEEVRCGGGGPVEGGQGRRAGAGEGGRSRTRGRRPDRGTTDDVMYLG